jgi:hypothetical protein
MKHKTKVCSECHEIVPLSEFYYNKGGPLSACKACIRHRNLVFYYSHAEQVKRYQAKYRARRRAEKKTQAKALVAK